MDKAPDTLNIAEPIAIFISYAPTPQDEQLFKELETRLKPLLRKNSITIWHQGKLSPGDERRRMAEQLEHAAVILLLISPDYVASEDCMLEMEQALALAAIGKSRVIPIHLRPAFIPDDPLHELQSLPRDGRPLTKHANQDEAFKDIVQEIHTAIKDRSEKLRPSQRERDLKALLADHSGFLQDRLKSFVGRVDELTRLRELIQEQQQTGGYITITGQAGQGKSSIIARLVEEYGIEQVASHFIPLSPGPDHQMGLLRNLMARLILKYNLTELYVASDNRAALRDYFPKVLHELVEKGGREIIFIDGLDQLEEDHNGVRDLSFLPTNPPPGVVFVLVTRPNDTMKPLELLKPHNEYRLPNLSRADFDLILEHRKVALEKNLADQFYAKMAGNALYLDLVARELLAAENIDIETLIARLTDNPAYIFSLSMQRLQRNTILWEKVIYPTFGLLLAAQEPLTFAHLKMLLGVPDYQIRDGLARMGGLITEDQQRRYNLFHLKLRDYLNEDKEHPDKEYLFSVEEVQRWHEVFADWCEQGSLQNIWQDTSNAVEQGRRMYSRHHYIAHLYHAHQRERLFAALDEVSYGQEKMRFDPSTQEYAQDLDYGRRASARETDSFEDGLIALSRLWRYTLLACSLRSLADQYPLEAFRLLLLLGREKEVIGLAELLTNLFSKVKVLLEIAKHLLPLPSRASESKQFFLRACEVAHLIEEDYNKIDTLRLLIFSLAQAQLWQQDEVLWRQAETVARSIQNDDYRAKALSLLVSALAQAQLWPQAETVARSIQNDDYRTEALRMLVSSLAQAQHWQQAEAIAHSIQNTYYKAMALSILASVLAQTQHWQQAEIIIAEIRTIVLSLDNDYHKAIALSAVVSALAQTQQWQQAEAIAHSIQIDYNKADALSALASTLAQAQQWQQAEAIARSIENSHDKAVTLSTLVSILAQAQQWQQAEAIARSIENSYDKAVTLSTLASALVQAQQRQQAEIITSEIKTIVLSIKDNDYRSEALGALTSLLIQAQQPQQAEIIISKFSRIIHFIKNNHDKARALSMLASALIQAKRPQQAETIAVEINAMILSIKHDNNKARALKALASSLAQAQQWQQAETLARSIQIDYYKADALNTLISALAQAQLWQQAETGARSIQVDNYLNTYKIKALSILASSFAQTQHWQQAEAVARSIEDNDYEANALSILVSALAQAQLWQQAEAVARSIEDNDYRIKALSALVSVLAQAQLWQQAQAIASEISTEVLTADDDNYKVEALSALAPALAQTQQWQQAQAIAHSIKNNNDKAQAFRVLIASYLQYSKHEQILDTIQYLWLQVEKRQDALLFFPFACSLVPLRPELGNAFYEAFQWVDTMLQ